MDDFLCGFPPPPPFYKNYSLKCPDPDASLDAKLDSIKDQIKEAEGLVFDYSKLTCFEGPKPPSPPTESWSSFGNIHKFQEEERTLDSETLIPPNPGTTDLREHFKFLYSQFMDSLLTYLDLIKNMNNDSISEIKKFMKVWNLFRTVFRYM
uniref:Mediator of RNA polymerase II transcription subunit 7 n=1 Tax=Theileria parva TaxID=5875 RepID=Q4N7C9_THEPA|eukprot:XP_766412.1 hypothetical protein [Theileria parva strain Muguga]